jgi:hypothetical protein
MGIPALDRSIYGGGSLAALFRIDSSIMVILWLHFSALIHP